MPLEVPVGPVEGTGAGPAVLRGFVRSGPPRRGVTPVLYCLAGGGCGTGYFDLEVAGTAGYSMAEHAAAAGAVVVALDHLGVGASDAVDDLFTVTPTVLAACHHRAGSEVVGRLAAGELAEDLPAIERPLVVGLGHSMGGMLAAVQQARHRSFGALVLLGTGGSGLPEVLTDDERAVAGPDLESVEAEIARLARLRFAPGSTVERRPPRLGTFFTDDVPAPVREAFARQAVPLLPVCALTSMIPGSAHAERAAVDVPLFLGFGDHDLLDDYLGALAQYRSVTDAALFVLAGSGHCHHQASGRRRLWDRLLAWVDTLAGSD
ncbi:MAG: alpha/beta fold hydrolase [Acidimicrobiales bacterium]